MKNIIAICFVIFTCSVPMTAFSENASVRELDIDEITIEKVLIGRNKFRKICIDGQAYWFNIMSNSITGSFKEGQPEQCEIPQTKQ